jgi:hypothetical protein
MDIKGFAADTLRVLADFVPTALAFLAILIIGLLAAYLLRALTRTLLTRTGFDRLVERGGIRPALARSGFDATRLVCQLVYYAILLVTLHVAFGVWGPNPISDLIYSVIVWLPRAFVAIVIIVVAAAIASWVRDLVSNALAELSYGRLLSRLAWVFIIGLGAIAALSQIGVADSVTTPILITMLATAGGILVVGVGGGLIRPMQSRWEHMLDRMQQESSTVAEHARAYAASQAAASQNLAAERVSASAAVPAQPTQYRSASVPVPTADATHRMSAAGAGEMPLAAAATAQLPAAAQPSEQPAAKTQQLRAPDSQEPPR